MTDCFNLLGDMTFEAWIRLHDTVELNTGTYLMTKFGSTGEWTYQIFVERHASDPTDGILQFRQWMTDAADSSIVATNAATLAIETDYHVVCVKSGPSTATWYVDAVAQANNIDYWPGTVVAETDLPVVLAGFYQSVLSGNALVMQEVALYDYALTPTQITDHFNEGTSGSDYAGVVLADAPIGYWRLNETSGLVAVDYAVTPHDGVYSDFPVLNQTSIHSADPTPSADLDFGKVTAECVDAVPGSCSLLETDDVLLVDATYQDVTVTLMDPAPLIGHVYYVKRIDTTDNTVTLDPGTLLIDGLPSLELLPWDTVALVTNGSEWWVV